MSDVALIILFNHNYEKNLLSLDEIYGSRFTNVWYVMPFYNGDRKDVISVYENSFYFQGYLAYALDRLKQKGYKHYFIIADDLYLNPKIDENNYTDFFKVNEDTAFIPGPFLLNDLKETRPSRPYAPFWGKEKYALNFNIKQLGIEVSKILPSYNQAKDLLSAHGLNFTNSLSYIKLLISPLFKKINTKEELRNRYYRFRLFFSNLKYIVTNEKLKYPLIGSYSDICIIPHKNINKFINYSGALASLHLFVEIALPTALLFSSSKVVSEDSLSHKGETYWSKTDVQEFSEKFNSSLSTLNENFPEDTLYIHPVKISQWKK